RNGGSRVAAVTRTVCTMPASFTWCQGKAHRVCRRRERCHTLGPMAGLRAAQKEMTRRLLLSTALELFESKGYAATTVDDIAAAAGTTRVTFYAYFPSRSDLMKELIAELNEILQRISSPDHGSTANDLVSAVRDGSRDAIGAWLVERSKQWDTIRPYTVAAFEAAAVDPELRNLVDQWIEEVASDIEEGLS